MTADRQPPIRPADRRSASASLATSINLFIEPHPGDSFFERERMYEYDDDALRWKAAGGPATSLVPVKRASALLLGPGRMDRLRRRTGPLVGLLLFNAALIPGLNRLATQDEILAWAAILGVGQQVLT
jgi:hypothetical protein